MKLYLMQTKHVHGYGNETHGSHKFILPVCLTYNKLTI